MTKPKKFVFVLMPFSDDFSDIYTLGIKKTCIELGAYCERVDEQIFHERILDRIYNQIAKADLIIADMTGRNANVFYEVGYAHALGKDVILLTQKVEDIPFDLQHFPHIIYGKKITALNDQLKVKLGWFLDRNTEDKPDVEFGLEFSIDGHALTNGAELHFEAPRSSFSSDSIYVASDSISVAIDVYNSSSKIFDSKFKIGFEFSKEYSSLIRDLIKIKSSTEKVLFVSYEINSVYPNAYESIPFVISSPYMEEGEEKIVIPATLKVFTSLELKEINFKLVFSPDNTSSW